MLLIKNEWQEWRGKKAFLASVRLTKFTSLNTTSLQCLTTSALSFGVYLVAILHILDITGFFSGKILNIQATLLFSPEKERNSAVSPKYKVRQVTLKVRRHYILFQLVLTKIKHTKKIPFYSRQMQLVRITQPWGLYLLCKLAKLLFSHIMG